MKTFTINGVKYTAKELDFNDICELEDMGINLMDFGNASRMKMFGLVRAYVALVTKQTLEEAGKALNGADFNEIIEAFQWAMENSDFFRAQSEGAEKDAQQIPSKKK